jgi:hypothetical protein
MAGQGWREAFFDPRKGPWLYVLGAYVLGISINLVTNYAAEWTQSRSLAWWLLVIGGPVAILLVSSSLLRRGFRNQLSTTGSLVARPRRSRGLVVIASRGDGTQTAQKAIEYHRPERLWVVHSDWSQADFETDVKGWALGRNLLSPDQIQPIALSDEAFTDPGVVQERIEREVFGALPDGWEESDVMIDITGGRKQTTAGAFLAGLPQGRRLEVNIPDKVDFATGGGKSPGDPVEIRIDFSLKRLRPR